MRARQRKKQTTHFGEVRPGEMLRILNELYGMHRIGFDEYTKYLSRVFPERSLPAGKEQVEEWPTNKKRPDAISKEGIALGVATAGVHLPIGFGLICQACAGTGIQICPECGGAGQTVPWTEEAGNE